MLLNNGGPMLLKTDSYSFGSGGFFEGGMGYPSGWALTAYYAFGPFRY
jgi:hypothetical protein